jgi:membrane-associated protein
MEWFDQLRQEIPSIAEVIRWGGLAALAGIVYTETGLFFGFFLPGDSLLVTAGLFAAKGVLDIVTLNLVLMACAIAGDNTGYWIGRKAGQALYKRKSSLFFKHEHLMAARAFYEKHGGKTIVLARFVPIVRTFAPVVAGIGEMPYRKFIGYSVAGGIGWVGSMTMIGYTLVRAFPETEHHIEKLILLVIFISVLPGLAAYVREKRKQTGG